VSPLWLMRETSMPGPASTVSFGVARQIVLPDSSPRSSSTFTWEAGSGIRTLFSK
jgi:hypothetical protein